MSIEIEIWSDIACPWCYLGKRRLEDAVAASGEDVSVRYRSFQLDPSIPADEATPHAEALAAKFRTTPERVREMNARLESLGAEAGIDYDFDRYLSTNTRDAHRLLHLAHEQGRGAQLKERLMRAQFSEGAVVSDHDTLVALAAEAGVDAGLAREVLASDRYDVEVQADIDQAAAYGATGVPFFVFDRAFAVSGAQPVETFALALRQAREARDSREAGATA